MSAQTATGEEAKSMTSNHPGLKPQVSGVTSKTIDGISDLVVWAPIREGFIDAFSNVTYETRLKQVGEALHRIRQSAREHELQEPFADTAKRILSLLDFRIGIVDRPLYEPAGAEPPKPRRYMFLVATFDGPWEPYIRLIWRPLGYFLDLLLCNCEGYVLASESDFETYANWVRDNQLDSAIFYSTSGLTVTDKIYLAELERIQRSYVPGLNDTAIASYSAPDPDTAASHIRQRHPAEALRLALEALNVLYKLTDYYPADTVGKPHGEGRLLLRAAQNLLGNYRFDQLPPVLAPVYELVRELYKEPVEWFHQLLPPDDVVRFPDPQFDQTEIQKGLLTTYDDSFVVTHGALILLRIDDPERARLFLGAADWSWEAGPVETGFETSLWDELYKNIFFTASGLARLGLTEGELAQFPKEFREGMTDRATLLGDKFSHHPRRWGLPARNWPSSRASTAPPVELSEVDFAIHARSGRGYGPGEGQLKAGHIPFGEMATSLLDASPLEGFELLYKRFEAQYVQRTSAFTAEAGTNNLGAFDWLLQQFGRTSEGTMRTPIEGFIAFIDLMGRRYGFSIISVQDMYRPDAANSVRDNRTSPPESSTSTDHFGFKDGISQPVIVDSSAEAARPTDVYAGDVLYGYRNLRGDSHLPQTHKSILFNGSFVAVRKIAQDVGAFRSLVAGEPSLEGGARLVGRTPDGVPLAAPQDLQNDFKYNQDPEGRACPFSAHIRLANPRGEFHGRRHPMMLRRGMSYGPKFEPDNPSTQGAERGVVFIAFCASLAEQYEVVQRWLNAGNPTGVASVQNDPLTGTPPASGPRVFRFFDAGGHVRRCEMKSPLTRLEWGHYFFCPSRTALLAITAPREARRRNPDADDGEAFLREIEAMPPSRQQEAWKRILEDFLAKDPGEQNIAPRVWQAIQARGGAYRISAGVAFDDGSEENTQPVVLVTDPGLIRDVFRNRPAAGDAAGTPAKACPYSSKEQFDRISQRGFGTIYVSLDAPDSAEDPAGYAQSRYVREAYPTNDILLAYSYERAVKAGFEAGSYVLGKQKLVAEKLAVLRKQPPEFKIELGRQYIQPALGVLCEGWFGIPDGQFIEPGGWNWNTPRKSVCPGDFMAPSRHAFYPRPSRAITKYGLRHGRALKCAVETYIERWWEDPGFLKGSVANQMHREIKARSDADPRPDAEAEFKDLLGRNLIGIMIGALPPMDANLRWTLYEWLETEALWRHQASLAEAISSGSSGDWGAMRAALEEPVVRAMSLRPAPDLIYRTVDAGEIDIGPVSAKRRDMVILCLPGATQALLADGTPSAELIFGGHRKAPDGTQLADHPLHACPAMDMAMGGMTGILAALLSAGRIQGLPASLIVRVSDWT